MKFKPNHSLLNGRYALFSPLDNEQADSETWLALSTDDTPLVARLWPYSSAKPSKLLRALWDAELRTQYRVSSTPGADGKILLLKDAGLDEEAKCFTMLLEAQDLSEYTLLSDFFSYRDSEGWPNLTRTEERVEIWRAFRRIAEGLIILHNQNIIHRNVRPKFLYLDRHVGIPSLTLGGFEWSIRVGVPSGAAPPDTWCTAPEVNGLEATGYSQEADWFSFGMTLARTLTDIENYSENEPTIRRKNSIKRIASRSNAELSLLEKECIFQLIENDPEVRLTNQFEILNFIDEIIQTLEINRFSSEEKDNLILSVNFKTITGSANALRNMGYIPNKSDPDESFNPNSEIHKSSILDFMRKEFSAEDGKIKVYSTRQPHLFVCETRNLTARLTPINIFDRQRGSHTSSLNALHVTPTDRMPITGDWVEVDGKRVTVLDSKSAANAIRRGRGDSWQNKLPKFDRTKLTDYDLIKYHTFIRAINQIEILMKDAEISAYCVESKDTSNPTKHTIVISERPRERQPLDIFQRDGTLAENVQETVASGKPHSNEFILSIEDSLRLDREENNQNVWVVDNVDTDKNLVFLSKTLPEGRRFGESSDIEVPEEGYIREWGLEAQLHDVQRRINAISRLKSHSFLLRAISGTGQVFFDTGVNELRCEIDESQVDGAKQSAIVDILRTRPIYCLEGPPGTGKTTLVAHLLRQIFEEDPVAQVLITSKSHDAVDVLKKKVDKGIFPSEGENQSPLSIRLMGRSAAKDITARSGSADYEAEKVLNSAIETIEAQDLPTERSLEWLINARKIVSDRDAGFTKNFNDFSETVRNAAGITYSTTSSGDLAALANTSRSFDWAIVEEAGKVYPFDIALPLQLGHRWLLIGDNKQLPPFRYTDFYQAVQRLDEVADALGDLKGSYGLIDREWLDEWSSLDESERQSFCEYSLARLFAFKHFFDLCSQATGQEKVTRGEPIGAASGELNIQHRMHPTIGNLISRVFYDGELEHHTQELVPTNNDCSSSKSECWIPISRVKHGIDIPELSDSAIVWLNLDWALKNPGNHDVGPIQKKPKFTNPAEIDAIFHFLRKMKASRDRVRELEIAAISPYVQQVNLLNEKFRQSADLDWVRLLPQTNKGVVSSNVFAHTVDSFQGNQADVVFVSLVRNNKRTDPTGMGFLVDPARLNVLLSRPKQLLILCGSFEFFFQATRSVDSRIQDGWYWKQVLHQLISGFKDETINLINADGNGDFS